MKRLKPLRQLNGLEREELGQKIGVSFGTIAAYEQGLREPNFEKLRKLSEIFNVSVDYLVENEAVITENKIIYAVEQMLENEQMKKDAKESNDNSKGKV